MLEETMKVSSLSDTCCTYGSWALMGANQHGSVDFKGATLIYTGWKCDPWFCYTNPVHTCELGYFSQHELVAGEGEGIHTFLCMSCSFFTLGTCRWGNKSTWNISVTTSQCWGLLDLPGAHEQAALITQRNQRTLSTVLRTMQRLVCFNVCECASHMFD